MAPKYITNDVCVHDFDLLLGLSYLDFAVPKLTRDLQELVEIIKSDKQPRKDYLVVDVRDDDYRGGHIKGSHNVPSQFFYAGVDKLVKETKDVPMIIFHCALSQSRSVNIGSSV